MPVEGMTVMPSHFDLPGMGAAWLGCVRTTLAEPEARKQFQRETGHNIEALVTDSPIEQMIDMASGHQRKVIAAFCDWVTLRIWGTD